MCFISFNLKYTCMYVFLPKYLQPLKDKIKKLGIIDTVKFINAVTVEYIYSFPSENGGSSKYFKLNT